MNPVAEGQEDQNPLAKRNTYDHRQTKVMKATDKLILSLEPFLFLMAWKLNLGYTTTMNSNMMHAKDF